jgi:hypothetical protein
VNANVTNNDNQVPGAVPLPARETSFVRFWRRLGGGSLLMAILLHVILLVAGAFWILRTLYPPDREKDVNFLPGGGGGGGGNNEVQKQAQRMARMQASQSLKRVVVEGASAVVMPDPGDDFGQLSSLSSLSGGGGMGGGSGFGRGGGHGNGVGPGSGDGVGSGGFGAGVVFFGMEMQAKRIAYVIDFSLSMKGKREQLMRAELTKSVSQLQPRAQFQIICFCGPAWIAGDQVEMELAQANDEPGKRQATVHHHGQDFKWKSAGHGVWEPDGKKLKADWLTADCATLDRTAIYIKETPLEYGTHWTGPLEMALEMQPAPEVIVFMTDGASPGTTDEMIKKIAARARTKNTIINTMSLMEPEADASMKMLAKLAKGKFTVIDVSGTPHEVPLDDEK